MSLENVPRICKMCGKEFNGTTHMWYCSVCKETRQKEQRAKELQRIKNKITIHYCCICGKEFSSYLDTATCSKECEKSFRIQRLTGRKFSDLTKSKIAFKNSLDWHIISPEGKHYKFHNLLQWSRDHCDLFGFEKNEKNAKKITAGISQAKGALLGTNPKAIPSYKNWSVVINSAGHGNGRSE